MRIWLLVTFCFLTVFAFCGAAEQKQQNGAEKAFESYDTPLTEQDKKNITFIISTLSGKSSVQLMFKKSALEKAGDEVEHVHPLKFLAFVFSSDSLKEQAKNITGVPWSRFSGDMSKSLSDAAKGGQMSEETVKQFAKAVGMDVSVIEPLIKEQQWKQLVNTVKEKS